VTQRSRTFTPFVLLALVALAVPIPLVTSRADALPTRPAAAGSTNKVMVIAEENEGASGIVGSAQAPYLNSLARTYGQLTDMDSGYPVSCPSLAAYIVLTSGDRHGICDDANPSAHQLSSDNIFRQVAESGRQWRQYSESMTTNCQGYNGAEGGYLVRHAPPPYYSSEAGRCRSWDLPLGTTSAGNLHDDLAEGLPAYSFVTPNACNDMHGADSCRASLVKRGDSWLAAWMPKILATSDFQAGRLTVVITWDEGTSKSNHIATVVAHRGLEGAKSGAAYTHCSTLRTTEELLGLPLLGCAASAPSYRTALGL
jgi:phosphatidylinositol-3-phosphatase